MIASEKVNFLYRGVFKTTVLVTGLGYLVDMYDLFLFNVVRVQSLTDMGLSGDALTNAGIFVANSQMAGLLLGAFLWGTMSDRIGRKPGLFASILVYSLGSLLCATIHNVNFYGLARFITGLGLAGELGSGLALIAEGLAAEKRGTGIMIFMGLGFAGVVSAALGSEFLSWRHMYVLGGLAGLGILGLRVLISESTLFRQSSNLQVLRGRFRLILCHPQKFLIYIAGIMLVTPTVFIPQILWTLSPEIGKAMGIVDPVKANIVLAIGYCSVMLGDIAASALSEWLKSRKKATLICLVLGIVVFTLFILHRPNTLIQFYACNALLGLTFGVWVVGGAWAAEQFGTNIRATVTTTMPSFCRATAIPMNLAFRQLKVIGPLPAITVIGSVVFLLSSLSWLVLKETYGKNLDFLEIDDRYSPIA